MSAKAGLVAEPCREGTKSCACCHEVKPRTEFYSDKRTKDRLNSYCKPCCRKKALDYRYAHLEMIQARHREYHRKNWEQNQINLKRTKAKNPEKELARVLVHRARRKGLLKRLPCEKCGDPNSQAHHDDYAKPLEVHWMCHKCHWKEHRRSPQGIAAAAAGR